MRNKIYNNKVMLTICVIIMLGASFLGGMQFVKAEKKVDYNKSFVSIEIKHGDTLTSIAQTYASSEVEYEDYIKEVKSINNLKSDIIHTGCYLIVPTYEIEE